MDPFDKSGDPLAGNFPPGKTDPRQFLEFMPRVGGGAPGIPARPLNQPIWPQRAAPHPSTAMKAKAPMLPTAKQLEGFPESAKPAPPPKPVEPDPIPVAPTTSPGLPKNFKMSPIDQRWDVAFMGADNKWYPVTRMRSLAYGHPQEEQVLRNHMKFLENTDRGTKGWKEEMKYTQNRINEIVDSRVQSREMNEGMKGLVESDPSILQSRIASVKQKMKDSPENASLKEQLKMLNAQYRASIKGQQQSGFVPPPASEVTRFYHGGLDPTSGGPRWVTTDPEYARNFRSGERPNEVHYVDIPKGDPTEVAARNWDEIDEASKTNMVGRYGHVEIPEYWAKKLKPFKGSQ